MLMQAYGYGYDPYGRPFMPPPQYQPQQSPYKAELDALYSRMKDMESKLYGNTHITPPQAPQAPQQAATGVALIPVNSPDEAWSYAADWTGAKQYFHNPSAGEIYIKWFDANTPETIRQVYRLDKAQNAVTTGDTAPRIDKTENIIKQLDDLKSEIADVKTLIADVTIITAPKGKKKETKGPEVSDDES